MKTQYLSKQEIYDGAVRHLFGQGALPSCRAAVRRTTARAAVAARSAT